MKSPISIGPLWKAEFRMARRLCSIQELAQSLGVSMLLKPISKKSQ